ncbi:phenylalanine--tRNA ligase subunit beta [Candidatus Dojkabacteria bacterium HGW-Dojkabacteria-1]|uniref:Phenylalanine--tRNA ligase beta subunit n=1 Tax=Candidatus Dojkabacteria bacterium HGW-Dojkabacteria-1 TaxID=2013761 RepID=A0A2N2F419_9BACT|nr:MAG: phenylalanine--tRNA ligase subunit beta [Candidatus Dojkabacteria bacterium HGW-Dojkabacteria-1]
MKLPIKVAEDYTGIKIEIEELLHILASKIGEVEDVNNLSEMYKGIFIAQITGKQEHPDAEKLGVYKITIGEDEDIQVVAGDKTLEIGDKVAYIVPGNIVPSTYKTSEEFEIKAIKMRGILSNGMLCSEKELNIGPDHTKVLKLDTNAPVGESFTTYFGFDDTVIDIENKALTNRGDLFGILGLAREIAGAKNVKFTSPDWYKGEIYTVEGENINLEIENQATNLCPRYVGVVIDNITVQESPVWLKSILLKSGIRPINNIVDITNYISILVGQPLHAFDYDKVVEKDSKSNGSAKITVRLAKDGETIHTLDNNLVTLTSNTLVIADSTNPIAIAGVIGGLDTEIDNNTKRIILESANFDRFNVRKTSMSLGIFTDAVTRFTKALDPNQCKYALQYACSLIKELSGGDLASKIVDIYPEVIEPKAITLSISKLNEHLGTSLTKEEITNILENIEYNISENNESEDFLTVLAPTFRTDISIPEDIHEDIGRIYGYENILPKLPLRDVSAPNKNRIVGIKSKIRSILSNSGANEIITYSFVSKDLIEKSNQDVNIAFHLKNALSPDLAFMRTSLLTSMLSKAQENIQRNIPTFCMYEFNIAHQKGNMDKFELPQEQWNMSLLFSTREDILDGNPYYQVKRYLDKIFNTLGIEGVEYSLVRKSSERDLPVWIMNIIPTFSDKGSALIMYKGNVIGIIGDFKNSVKSNFKLPTYTAGLEINIEKLAKLKTNKKIKRDSSKYPSITQDLTFVVEKDMEYKDLEKILYKEIDSKNRKANIECIDIYSKDGIQKSITIRITIEHMEKTLSDKDFEKIVEKITKTLNK